MKINEVITEAGVWDTVKTIGSAAKGAVQGIGAGGMRAGAQAGIAAQQAKQQQTRMTNTISTQALQQWAKIAQAMTTAGQTPNAAAATQWFTNFSGVNPGSPAPGDNPAQINQWLKKEISGYIANKALAKDGTFAQPQDAQPGQPAQPGEVPEPQPGQPMTPQQAQAEKTSKVGTGQINKLIPTLRTRDLQSVKKTVDATIAAKAKTKPAALGANKGTVTQTPTGVVNKANPANPNQAFAQPGSTQVKPTAV